jgi:hypothetical protein
MAVLTEAIEAGREAGVGRVNGDARVVIVMTTAPVVTSIVAQDVPARAHPTMIATTVPPDESVKKRDVPGVIAKVAVVAALAVVVPANPPS